MHFLSGPEGLPTLDKNIKVFSIQLYNTSSLRTSIILFINSSDGEEKMNLPLIEELPLGTLTKRVALLKSICKIKRQILIKEEEENKYNESLWDCDGTLKDWSSLLVNGNEFTTSHFIGT
jgi:hypothetical protein